MKNKKIRVAILFGGRSAEHDVSIQSAKNVFQSLDKNKYDVSLIGIDREGEWHSLSEKYLVASSFTHDQLAMSDTNNSLVTAHGKANLISIGTKGESAAFDVVFPVLHGPYGEDGSMQGFLKLTNIPFVGSGVLGSAVGMDKDVSKRLLRDAGLPISKFLVVRKDDKITFEKIERELGLPFFIKPANLGSSIGVSKVKEKKDFLPSIAEAFAYDTKILIEEFIPGKEIECSVLGNDNPIVSVPGEIVANQEFYSYGAKYLDEHGATVKIPADLSKKQIEEVQSLALKAFNVLCLDGMARMDFFCTPEGKFYLNEANTIPGFTNISMYPKLWEASGISYSELVDKLITLAIDKHKQGHALKQSL